MYYIYIDNIKEKVDETIGNIQEEKTIDCLKEKVQGIKSKYKIQGTKEYPNNITIVLYDICEEQQWKEELKFETETEKWKIVSHAKLYPPNLFAPILVYSPKDIK